MPAEPVDLSGARILITGPTGQVAQPVVQAWADKAEIFALARFSDPAQREALEQAGVHTLKADLAAPDGLRGLPDDFDYVLNFAVVKTDSFDYDLAANAEGVGRLISHCRKAKAFLHLSSTAVYEYAGHEPRAEDSPLGDNHRSMFPTYSISKIAAEAVCRYAAKEFGVPAIIARLSVPYGDNGGWPWYHLLMMQGGVPIDVHPERPNTYNLLHVDDYMEKLPRLLAAAGTEVPTVNFGGSQAVSIEEWCAYLQELTGFEPVFQDNPKAFGSLAIDPTRMHELIGPTRVDWKDGIRRMVANLAPELLRDAG
ncbi:NAD-dependent epimerase/dehydratase family protein [Haliea atlantica]|jgi:nucleoside-diphosphate-sugar epimerase|tara:strand:+ start:112291 stop:113223 length:933 start_codon:yes stop_codon:yes gene_type:complete